MQKAVSKCFDAVKLDSEEIGNVIFPPYRVNSGKIGKGKHLLELTLYGSRQNCF